MPLFWPAISPSLRTAGQLVSFQNIGKPAVRSCVPMLFSQAEIFPRTGMAAVRSLPVCRTQVPRQKTFLKTKKSINRTVQSLHCSKDTLCTLRNCRLTWEFKRKLMALCDIQRPKRLKQPRKQTLRSEGSHNGHRTNTSFSVVSFGLKKMHLFRLHNKVCRC